MNDDALVIRGVGLITPLGLTAAQNWEALLAGRDVRDLGRAPLNGQANAGGDRVAQLAHAAATEAIDAAGWKRTLLSSPGTALFVGTSKGAIDSWLASIEEAVRAKPFAPLPQYSTSDNPAGRQRPLGLHSLAGDLAALLGLAGGGPRSTISAACASGLCALVHAAIALRHGTSQRALVVAAESSLHPLVLQSYRRLGVLAEPGQAVRPFDENRSGFQVSEAAVAVCIERCASACCDDVLLDAWALGADASHLTGMDPSGQAIRDCLARAVGANRVDLVHAHATGTVAADPIELAAIEAACGRNEPDGPVVYSHKGAIGHSMGASGLISVALNVLMHRAGRVLPNPNTARPIAHERVRIEAGVVERRVDVSVVIAAGFGGPVAAVCLYRPGAGS